MARKNTGRAVFFAVLAAALYALSTPVSKYLMAESVGSKMMAALLYLGAGLGMALIGMLRRATGREKEKVKFGPKDMPYVIGMIVLDIAAPIFLMAGLVTTTAANASLMNNFEIVATSLIALAVFKEKISLRIWWAIGLITLSTMILSFEGGESLNFSAGSMLVLLACVCWGFENNCTRMLSEGDPLKIVVVKGFGSGTGALLIALASGEALPGLLTLCAALLLGFVAYGLSIYFYVYAQRDLGAARTSAYYAVAPFIGSLLSMLIFRSIPGMAFWLALIIMALGVDQMNEQPILFKKKGQGN